MLPGTLYHVNTAQATGLCQSRRGEGGHGGGRSPVRCTPQIQSSQCPKPQWLREEEEAGSSDIQPLLVSTPPQPTVGLLAPALYTPPHSSLLCVNY